MSDPSGSSTPKAIGSLAKKQSDVTRQGTQKLKFVPTLPQRRKKEDVKQEPASAPASALAVAKADHGSTTPRGAGRGDVRGRGRGRGAPPVVEMTASGPFAMGPGQAGSSSQRSAPRSNFVPGGAIDLVAPRLGSSLSQTGPPSLRKDDEKETRVKVEEDEVYSDPEEGVEIVDMDQVRQMDWMAPDILRKERRKIKEDDLGAGPDHAWNLTESEEAEELEDIIESFTAQAKVDADASLREERLYLFQFPSPFPTFVAKKGDPMDIDERPDTIEKKVTFAPDTKMDPSSSRTPSVVPDASKPKRAEHVDGLIGQLEVYRSGAVKMRLANDILLDVIGGTQPSFLQQVVCLDKAEKQVVVLGEVNKQFVVSPNVEALLSALEKEATPSVFQDGDFIAMD